MEPERIYLTIKRFIEEYKKTGWITYDSVRYLIRHQKTNGFSLAFKKVGKRILIDVNEFWDIVDKKNGE